MAGLDPISFEVIRNALVAATDEMVLALKRSAYSTNIKTRSDFSCAFFDAELRLGRPGVRAAGAPRLDGRAGAEGGARRTARSNLAAGDVIVTNDPHPSGVHLNDVSLISPVHHDGRADRLRREPRPPRRRRRRRARVDRRVPRGVPGGRDHPAGQARRGRRDRAGRLRPDPGADPLEARDGGRLPRPDRRERDRRAPRDGARRPSRTRDDPRDDGGAPRVHGAAYARRARGAPGAASTRPRAPSTTTATPTSRFVCRRASRSTPTASAST